MLLSEAAVSVLGSMSVGLDFLDTSGVSSCMAEKDVVQSEVSAGTATSVSIMEACFDSAGLLRIVAVVEFDVD